MAGAYGLGCVPGRTVLRRVISPLARHLGFVTGRACVSQVLLPPTSHRGMAAFCFGEAKV